MILIYAHKYIEKFAKSSETNIILYQILLIIKQKHDRNKRSKGRKSP
jgi:hypothetical protein